MKANGIINFDEEGKLIGASGGLFEEIDTGTSLFSQIPFFLSLKSSMASLCKGDEIAYPLVHLDFFGVTGYYDFSITFTGSFFSCGVRKVKFSKVLGHAMQERNNRLIQQEYVKVCA